MAKHRDLRIILCTPGFPTSADDADKPFLLDHAVALQQAGLEVTVVCPMVNGAPTRQLIEEIEIIRVPYAPRRFQTLASTGSMYQEAKGAKSILVLPMLFCLTLATMGQLRRKNTIAYGHWWVPGGLVAVTAALLCRRPSIVHLHGSDAAIATPGPIRRLARWVLRRADIGIAVSHELADWGEQVSDNTLEILSMPVDLERLPRPSEAPTSGLVLAVGRLVPEKGFDVLIDAAALIEQSMRPEITIVGDGPERSRLRDRARRLGVALHLPGSVSPRDIGDWYRRASVVVVPSRREGFGMVAAEAAAAGRAVIGTEVGALPQILENGVSGLLVPPEDQQALCNALVSIDPAYGAQGPAKVAELSLEVHGQRVRRLCEDLLK